MEFAKGRAAQGIARPTAAPYDAVCPSHAKGEEGRVAFFVIGTTLSPLPPGSGVGGGGMYGKETLRLT
jgi:hypothetical protein